MTNVLITGGSGFIGTNLVDHYLRLRCNVRNIDTAAPVDRRHVSVWRKVDLLESRSLAKAIEEFEPNLVFHFGARTDLHGASVSEYAQNTAGVDNLLSALARLGGVRLAVFASSMLVCRIGYQPKGEEDYCPSTAYGESKVVGEKLVRERLGERVPWVIVRPTSIWGPWFRAPYRDFFTAVQRGIYVHPRHRRIHRSYGFVLNSTAQLQRLADLKGGNLVGRTVYLADYEPIELKHWAEMIQREFKSAPIREVPLWMFRAAAACGDAMKALGYRMPPMSSFRLNNLLSEVIHDTAPLRDVCGPIPYTAEEGVRLTCDWLRAENP